MSPRRGEYPAESFIHKLSAVAADASFGAHRISAIHSAFLMMPQAMRSPAFPAGSLLPSSALA